MDNRTFNELLQEGEIDLILMDGPESLTKKQLKIIEKTVNSVGRDIPETMKKKASFNPMKMIEMLGAGTLGALKRISGHPIESNKLSNRTNIKKISKKESAYYTTVSEGQNNRLRRGDGAAVILAKMFNFMKKIHDDKLLHHELDSDFQKEKIYEEKLFQEKTKRTLQNIPKPKFKLIRTTTPSFSSLIKALGFAALLFFADEVRASLEEFIGDVIYTKQRIIDGIEKIKDYLLSINILGFKPFEFILGPKKEEIRNISSLRELVKQAEGGLAGYDALVIPKGGIPQEFKSYKPSEMTIGEVLKLQDKMKSSGKFPSTAVGAFQIVKGTLQGAISFLGDLDLNTRFSKEIQNKIFDEYIIVQKRPEIGAYIRKEKGATLSQAQLGLSKEFASFGVPEDMIVRRKGIDKFIKKGESYYKDVGDNEASVSPEKSEPLLRQSREVQENKTIINTNKTIINTPEKQIQPQLTPIPEKKLDGDKISMILKKNNDMKKEINSSIVIADTSVHNTFINSSGKKQMLTIPSSLDLPMFLQVMS
jgi:hypothetical protein